MNGNRGAFDQSLVALHWVWTSAGTGLITCTFLCRVTEEARADGHSDSVVIGAARHEVVLVSIHDTDELCRTSGHVHLICTHVS